MTDLPKQALFDRWIDNRCKNDPTQYSARFLACMFVTLAAFSALVSLTIIGFGFETNLEYIGMMLTSAGMLVLFATFPVIVYAAICAGVTEKRPIKKCLFIAWCLATIAVSPFCAIIIVSSDAIMGMIVLYTAALIGCGGGMAAARGVQVLMLKRIDHNRLMHEIDLAGGHGL